MKKLSTKILEIVTNLLCGDLDESFSRYRSVGELREFFKNAKVQVPSYIDGKRREWVLRSLKKLDKEDRGKVIPLGLQKVLERLSNPLEWEGDNHQTDQVVEFLNCQLIQEEIIIAWRGNHKGYILRPLTIEEKKIEPNKLLKTARRDVNSLVDFLSFHPKIKEASEKLFKNGHYSQAVFEAFKAIEVFVKEKSGQTNLNGRSLMEKVFNKDNAVLRLNDLNTRSDLDEQEGFKFLFMGAVIGIRNPGAHDNVRLKDPYRALEYLSFASLLAYRVDKSEKS